MEASLFKGLEFAETPGDACSGHIYRYPGKGVIDHLYISRSTTSQQVASIDVQEFIRDLQKRHIGLGKLPLDRIPEALA